MDADLNYIERTLAGNSDASVHQEFRAPPKRRRISSRSEQQAKRQRGCSGHSQGFSSGGQQEDTVPPTQPGSESNPRAWYCEICNAWVSRGESAACSSQCSEWRVHISGKSHRRQLLSIRETGAPGRLLVSKFETLSARDIQRFQRANGTQSAMTKLRLEDAGLTWLHRAAVKELLNHMGASSSDYGRLCKRLSLGRLEDAWSMLVEKRWPRRFFQQLTVNRCGDGQLHLGVDAAMLAAVSHAMCRSSFPYTNLVLDVLDGRPSDQAVLQTGLVLLCHALRHSNVTHLTLCFCSLSDDGISLDKLHPLVKALSASFETCTALRKLSIKSAAPVIPAPRAFSFMRDVWAAASHNKLSMRTVILHGLLHRPRGAGREQVPELPADVLIRILDMLAPLESFQVEVESSRGVRYWYAGGS